MKKLKLFPIFVCFFCLVDASLGAREHDSPDYFNMDLLDLMQVQVVSPSKRLSTIRHSPSYIDVISREDIRKQGARTLSEVLERIPGFFVTRQQAFPVLSNRGLIQDMNNNFLLLIDGHSVNAIAEGGMYHEDRFPLLSYVERIEIIHSPGSTLWGTDAGSGIINIITRDVEDLLRNTGKLGYMELDQDYSIDNSGLPYYRASSSLQYANRLGEKSSFYLSGTYFDSRQKWDEWYKRTKTGYKLWDNRVHPHNDWEPGGELFAKIKLNKITIRSRFAQLNDVAGRLTYLDSVYSHQSRMNQWTDIRYETKLSSAMSLESRLFYDEISYRLFRFGLPEEEPDASEAGVGGEVMLTADYEKHKALVGMRYKQTHVSDGINDTYGGGVDHVFSLYAEDNWRFIEQLFFIYGLRAEYNDLREEKVILLPRFSAVFLMKEHVTVKYMFNSGYLRPSLKQSLGGNDPNQIYPYFHRGEYFPTKKIGAERSQRIYNNDLQFLYNSKNWNFSANFFYTYIRDYITWAGSFSVPDTLAGETIGEFFQDQNLTDATSRGVELVARYSFVRNHQVYLNYTYAVTQLNDTVVDNPDYQYNLVRQSSLVNQDGVLTGTPLHMWNAGVHIRVLPKMNLNIHYRGYTKIQAKESTVPRSFPEYGPYHLFDATLFYNPDVIGGRLSLSLYGKNLLNNREATPMAILGGYSYMTERNVGVRLGIRL